MRKTRGISIAESLVSMAILIGLMLTIFNLLPGGLLAIEDAQEQLRASLVAQSMLEQARVLPAAQLKDVTQSETVDPFFTTETLTVAHDPGDSHLVTLTAAVGWSNKISPQAITRHLQIYTLQ
ncbi:MAG: hypothetical protein ACYCW6_05480 [Candidatus Xenobia bacterium]